jgi:PIN domain nuclease of toxin-antitoxin system
LIYLDTHIVVWFYANDKQRFSTAMQTLMNQHEWTISPVVRLELQYLHEIGRINPTADTIIGYLVQRVGLTLCSKPFNDVIAKATQLSWTRDPFNRILVAQASLHADLLVTSDQTIRARYPHAASWSTPGRIPST